MVKKLTAPLSGVLRGFNKSVKKLKAIFFRDNNYIEYSDNNYIEYD